MLRHSEAPQVSEIQDMRLFQLRELVRVRHRLIEKQALCKVQIVRNIDSLSKRRVDRKYLDQKLRKYMLMQGMY